MWLIACASCALMGHAQTLPAGKGRAEFQRVCSSCHSVSMATSQRMDQAQWTGVVNDMVSKGAQGTQQDFDNIVAYLTENVRRRLELCYGEESSFLAEVVDGITTVGFLLPLRLGVMVESDCVGLAPLLNAEAGREEIGDGDAEIDRQTQQDKRRRANDGAERHDCP